MFAVKQTNLHQSLISCYYLYRAFALRKHNFTVFSHIVSALQCVNVLKSQFVLTYFSVFLQKHVT